MRNFFYILGLLSALVLGAMLVISCEDDEQVSDPNPNTPPNVEVVSPAQGSIYNAEDIIPLKLTIEQDADILSYRVLVRNQNTGVAVWSDSDFTSTSIISLDTSMILSTVSQSIMEIEVRAEDSFGNQIDEVVSTFTLNPPQGNTLTLNFDLSYDDELFILNQEYEYPTGEKFEFSRFDMYVSDVALLKGGEEVIIADVDYLKMTETFALESTASEGYPYSIAGIEDGDFDGIKFNIGLTPELNSTTPSDYPVSNPLGLTGDYWPTWNSYIFASIEGRMNIDTSNPDYEQGLALHLGSDDAMRTISLNNSISLSNEQEQIITIQVELRNLFVSQDGEVYDIKATPATHSLSQIPQVIELSDNLKNSINN